MTDQVSKWPHERTAGRWYSVTRDGLATLCLDEANAREMAAMCDRDYPKHAPHKAMQIVDAADFDRLLAKNDALEYLLRVYVHAHRMGNAAPKDIEQMAMKLLMPG